MPPSTAPTTEIARRLSTLLEEQPGLDSAEIAAALGLGHAFARRLLRDSFRLGIVCHERQSLHRLYFPAPMPKRVRTCVALLRVSGIRAVAGALIQAPDSTVAMVAERAGKSKRETMRAMRRLAKRGLVRITKGRPASVAPHPDLRIVWSKWVMDADFTKKLVP